MAPQSVHRRTGNFTRVVAAERCANLTDTRPLARPPPRALRARAARAFSVGGQWPVAGGRWPTAPRARYSGLDRMCDTKPIFAESYTGGVQGASRIGN